MQVKDMMTTKPSYCEPHWTVEAVASLMDHVGTGIVPVVEGVISQTLVGVVTDRDICVRVVAPGLYPAHTCVIDCMTPHPICCRQEEDAEIALQRMRDQQVRRLPVVDGDMHLLGMLSISDFVRSESFDIKTVASALKRICQPRVESGTSVKVLRIA